MKTSIRALLVAAIVASPIVPAYAQTADSNAEILQGLQSTLSDAPQVSAQALRDLAKAHIVQYPGANPPPLSVQLDNLAQINVQIQFDLNSAMIKPESYRTIGSIADALHHPILMGYRFIVVGNTDATGTRERNLVLSQERADAIVQALTTTFGVNPASLESVGLGQEALQDTKNPDAAVNRRVQIFNIGKLK
ncbi:OmpA family protein [Ancylobacter terrae]|uniref:OmpA family protein n=1 Tax=Ancylobacter sp. sgz301288 TaxID=3342077 RepID=UPI00385CBC58